MASLTDNIMQQLSFFLHQRLSSVAQEMLVQVEKALALALDKEKTQSPGLQTPVPAAPEVERNFTHGNQPMTHPTHDALPNIKQELVCVSRVDQSNEAQDCDVKETEEPIQELKGFIEPISEVDDDDDDDVNATTATDKLETDFDSFTDDSNDTSWGEHGAKPLKKKTESEQPVIAKVKSVTQSEERPFSCDFCGKGFNHKRNVLVHKRKHTGERPYQSFMYSNYLKMHKLTHTGTTPHQCNVCNKSFRLSGHLTIHKRSHTVDWPYQCDVCSNYFIKSSSLKRHKRTHTGEKPYSCDVCGNAFTKTRFQRSHMCSKPRDATR